MMESSPQADYGDFLYTFGLVADVQGGDKPDHKFKYYRYICAQLYVM